MKGTGGLMSGFGANGNDIAMELKAYRKRQQQAFTEEAEAPHEEKEEHMEITSIIPTRHPLDFVETMDVLYSVPNLNEEDDSEDDSDVDDSSDVDMIQDTAGRTTGNSCIDSDSEDDISPSAPTRRPEAISIPEISIRGHDFRWGSFGCKKINPYNGIDRDHPVYESMCFVIPHSDLLSHSGGLVMNLASDATTWGKFAPTERARATKRLFYLLIHAIEMCMQTPSGNIEDYKFPKKKASKKKKEPDKEKTAKKGLSQTITRPAGVGGAVTRKKNYNPMIINLNPLAPLLESADFKQLRRRPGAIDGLFVLEHLRNNGNQSQAEEDDDDDDDRDSRSYAVVLKRITVVMEELMEETGGKTAGWRLWVLGHDPKIVLSQWINLAILENKKLYENRQALLERAHARQLSKNIFKGESFDDIETPNCYRAIRNIEDYAKNVKLYWQKRVICSIGQQNFLVSGIPDLCPPEMDAETAASGNLLSPTGPMHPSRIFSPIVAMSLHCSQVCLVQTSISSYVAMMTTKKLGIFPREHWSTYYNISEITPKKMHMLRISEDDSRKNIVRNLKAEAMKNGILKTVPREVSEAMRGQSGTALDLMDKFMRDPDLRQGQSREETMHGMQQELNKVITEFAIHNRQSNEKADALTKAAEERAAGGADPFDGGDSISEEARAGFSAEEWSSTSNGSVPDPNITENFMASLLASEGDSNLEVKMVRRSPLLQMRLINSRNYKMINQGFESTGRSGSEAHKLAIIAYREKAIMVWWTTLLQHMVTDEDCMDWEKKLSTPLRDGLKFFINLRPNLIRRHVQRIQFNQSKKSKLLNSGSTLSASYKECTHSDSILMSSYMNQVPDASTAMPMSHSSSSSKGIEQDMDETSNLWHEWPIGAKNLGMYGNWRVSMQTRMLLFRPRPGATTILYRFLLAQGCACQYFWGIRPNQLMTGRGGVGKSFILSCCTQQGFPSQYIRMDNVTEKALAISHDKCDEIRLFQEVPNALIGLDFRGKDGMADPLQKAAMSENRVDSTQCHVDKETGFRHEQHSMSRQMVLMYGATNATNLDLRKPIMQRWQTDSVAPDEGELSTPLSAITNSMVSEKEIQDLKVFCHQLRLTNVYVMLIEKLIEARVHPVDVSTEVCGTHFSWFFEAVRRKCRVPEIDSRQQDMLRLLCRQAAIRYAIHLHFFSEFSAELRTRRRSDAARGDYSPETYEGVEFHPKMLLGVLPHLWVSEEVMTDVLTSTVTTYTPVSTWNLTDLMAKLYRTGFTGTRKIPPTKQKINSSLTTTTTTTEKENSTSAKVVVLGVNSNTNKPQEGAPNDDTSAVAQMQREANGFDAADEEQESTTQVTDENYTAIEVQNRTLGYEYLSLHSDGKLGPTMVQNVLKQLAKMSMNVKNRNKPLRHSETGEYILDQAAMQAANTRIPIFKYTEISRRQPVVIIESVPSERINSQSNAYTNSNSRGYGGGGKQMYGNVHQQPRIQICFLKEYLEKRSRVKVVDILQQGLSTRGVNRRWIITGSIREIHHTVYEFGLGGPSRVTREFLDARLIVPDPTKMHNVINYFSNNDQTDQFRDNMDLNPETGEPFEFGTLQDDPDRNIQKWIQGDIDEIMARRYWNDAGILFNEENYPRMQHQRILEMVCHPSQIDDIGCRLSNRMKENYPRDTEAAELVNAPPKIRLYKSSNTEHAAAAAEEETLEAEEAEGKIVPDFLQCVIRSTALACTDQESIQINEKDSQEVKQQKIEKMREKQETARAITRAIEAHPEIMFSHELGEAGDLKRKRKDNHKESIENETDSFYDDLFGETAPPLLRRKKKKTKFMPPEAPLCASSLKPRTHDLEEWKEMCQHLHLNPDYDPKFDPDPTSDSDLKELFHDARALMGLPPTKQYPF